MQEIFYELSENIFIYFNKTLQSQNFSPKNVFLSGFHSATADVSID